MYMYLFTHMHIHTYTYKYVYIWIYIFIIIYNHIYMLLATIPQGSYTITGGESAAEPRPLTPTGHEKYLRTAVQAHVEPPPPHFGLWLELSCAELLLLFSKAFARTWYRALTWYPPPLEPPAHTVRALESCWHAGGWLPFCPVTRRGSSVTARRSKRPCWRSVPS